MPLTLFATGVLVGCFITTHWLVREDERKVLHEISNHYRNRAKF